MNKSFLIIFSLLIVTLPVQSLTSEIKVIDADTIVIKGAKIRLNGIDAPEKGQNCRDKNAKVYRCGVSSTNALLSLIKNFPQRIVQCQYMGKDAYGRFIGECSIGKININMWLVENGWALAYRRYSKKYVKNENIAKSNLSGIWSGDFIEPWEWRRGKRLPLKID